MQPIRARSLNFVTTLRANEPSRTVCKPLQTLREAEETFFCKVLYLFPLLAHYFHDGNYSSLLRVENLDINIAFIIHCTPNSSLMTSIPVSHTVFKITVE